MDLVSSIRFMVSLSLSLCCSFQRERELVLLRKTQNAKPTTHHTHPLLFSSFFPAGQQYIDTVAALQALSSHLGGIYTVHDCGLDGTVHTCGPAAGTRPVLCIDNLSSGENLARDRYRVHVYRQNQPCFLFSVAVDPMGAPMHTQPTAVVVFISAVSLFLFLFLFPFFEFAWDKLKTRRYCPQSGRRAGRRAARRCRSQCELCVRYRRCRGHTHTRPGQGQQCRTMAVFFFFLWFGFVGFLFSFLLDSGTSLKYSSGTVAASQPRRTNQQQQNEMTKLFSFSFLGACLLPFLHRSIICCIINFPYVAIAIGPSRLHHRHYFVHCTHAPPPSSLQGRKKKKGLVVIDVDQTLIRLQSPTNMKTDRSGDVAEKITTSLTANLPYKAT